MKDNQLFAAQWDGIYSKKSSDTAWVRSSTGLPEKFATTELAVFGDMLITAGSGRAKKGQGQ